MILEPGDKIEIFRRDTSMIDKRAKRHYKYGWFQKYGKDYDGSDTAIYIDEKGEFNVSDLYLIKVELK